MFTLFPDWPKYQLSDRLLLFVIVLASLLTMSPSVAEVDLWGHIQYGRDVLSEGLPQTTTYSFTAEGYPWINHENIPEIALAWTADHFGNVGLLVGKMLLAFGIVLAILSFNLRQGVGMIASGAITMLVAANLGFHFSLRPQVASFVCFTLMILILQVAFRGWRDRWLIGHPRQCAAQECLPSETLGYNSAKMRWLWAVPLVFVIWANSHGGFPAGVLIYFAYLAGRSFEAFWQRGHATWGLQRRFALMGIVGLLATFINPYSYKMHLWLWEAVGNPCPEISDWCIDELWTITGAKFWLLVLVCLSTFYFSRRSWDFTQTIVLAVVLWQSLIHFRHVPFFAILCGFWCGPHLQATLDRVSRWSERWLRPQESFTNSPWVTNAVWSGVLVWLVIGNIGRLNFLSVDKSQFPVDAFQFMADHEINGRMVVTYDWAQYALYTFCTRQSVTPIRGSLSFDGRYRTCYPYDLCDYHFDFLFGEGPGIARFRKPSSKPCDPARILSLGEPELVINRRFKEQTERIMKSQSEKWVLLYQDAVAQVWGRRDIFDNQQDHRYLPLTLRSIGDRLDSQLVAWPALPCPKSPAIQPVSNAYRPPSAIPSQSTIRRNSGFPQD